VFSYHRRTLYLSTRTPALPYTGGSGHLGGAGTRVCRAPGLQNGASFRGSGLDDDNGVARLLLSFEHGYRKGAGAAAVPL